MSRSFQVQPTSARSASVEDVWLDPPADPEGARTRLVLRAEIVDNVHSAEARVRASLVHQRRHGGKDEWRDVDSFSLAQLRAGQEVRLRLDTGQTLQLFEALDRLYSVSAKGVPRTPRRYRVVTEPGPHSTAEILAGMAERGGDEFWRAVEALGPELFEAVALRKLHALREAAVRTFTDELRAGRWAEADWQRFFEANPWIFGYGLSYRFLHTLQAQPHYGGTAVTGRGGQRGDFLLAGEGERQFTVLVEIKKPGSRLVGDSLYRNQVPLIGADLAGGIAQLQTNLRTWEIEGSRTSANRDILERREQFTVQPRGILVIGHTGQLDTREKRDTFELFRRNVFNPEVVTFDELLGRARHLLLTEEMRQTKSPPAQEDGQDGNR